VKNCVEIKFPQQLGEQSSQSGCQNPTDYKHDQAYQKFGQEINYYSLPNILERLQRDAWPIGNHFDFCPAVLRLVLAARIKLKKRL